MTFEDGNSFPSIGFFFKNSKKQVAGRSISINGLSRRDLEERKSFSYGDELDFCKKNVFKKKNVAEGQIVTELTDPQCQKQTSKNVLRTSICNGIEGF